MIQLNLINLVQQPRSFTGSTVYFPPQTHLEVLEAEDVQDADGLEVLFAPDAAVESADDPVETLGVKCHGHGVPGVHRLHATR